VSGKAENIHEHAMIDENTPVGRVYKYRWDGGEYTWRYDGYDSDHDELRFIDEDGDYREITPDEWNLDVAPSVEEIREPEDVSGKAEIPIDYEPGGYHVGFYREQLAEMLSKRFGWGDKVYGHPLICHNPISRDQLADVLGGLDERDRLKAIVNNLHILDVAACEAFAEGCNRGEPRQETLEAMIDSGGAIRHLLKTHGAKVPMGKGHETAEWLRKLADRCDREAAETAKVNDDGDAC